jgi:hypothetical protein
MRVSRLMVPVAVTLAMAVVSARAQADSAEVEPAPASESDPPPVPVYTPGYSPEGAYPTDNGLPPGSAVRWMPASGFGMAVMAGGGVTDFTQGATRNLTGTGGAWDVRFVLGTRYFLGFEASYVGASTSINGLGLSGNSSLVRNGVEGGVRINVPLYARQTLLEPYFLGGAGWNSYRVSNVQSFTASVTTDSDNVVSVPLGVGFSVGYKGFVGDLRYTIRPTFRQTIIATEGSSGLTNWDAGAMIGYEF